MLFEESPDLVGEAEQALPLLDVKSHRVAECSNASRSSFMVKQGQDYHNGAPSSRPTRCTIGSRAVIADAGHAECYTAPETYPVDLI
jgi:hypothetical protein